MVSLFDGSGDRERERRDEILSAYVDGELSEEERRTLEDRLSRDPKLRAALRAMHRTVSLMRELPEVEAPRNFILTPSMAGRQVAEKGTDARRRKAVWLAPLLTAATTVVSLLFAIVLVGDLLLPGIGGVASAPAPMRQAEDAPAVALEAAPTQEGEAERPEAPSLPSPSPPSAADKETVEELSEEESAEEPRMFLEEEAAATEAMRATRAPAGAGALPPPTEGDVMTEDGALSEPPAALMVTPTPDALSLPTVAPTVTPPAVLTPTIPPEEPVVSEDELGLLEPTPGELEVTPPLPGESSDLTGVDEPRSVPLLAVEIVLGLSSLVLLVVTVRAWRRR